MSAPTDTVRGTPVGTKLKDGFVAKITFAADPDVSFWEKSVKAPSKDGGEPIEQTTMWNTLFHTYAPRTLIKTGECTGTAAYDPNVMTTQIDALINVPTTITIRISNGQRLCFFGWLMKVEYSDYKEGEQPELTYTVFCSNTDPSDDSEQRAVLVGT